MALDGPGFHVEIDVLESASASMDRVAHDQDGFELHGLCGEPDLYGHAGVHDALANYCDKFSLSLTNLANRAKTMSGKLADAASLYRDVDASKAASLTEDPGVKGVNQSEDPIPGGASHR